MIMSMPAVVQAFESQRRHHRANLDVEVSLEGDHNFFVGFSENVSEGGLFVATHSLREIGSIIRLTFQLPDRPRPIEVDAVVRWIRLFNDTSDVPPGLGLQFIELSDEDAHAIRGFVERRAPLFWE
jgi:uncharacterized protein (TIGR02266 family)